ncbi:MAG: hypothetical protein C4309_11745, partial [Chloroflexota bacterium]
MRIGLDARLTYYTHGGIARYIRHLMNALQAIDAENQYIILHSRKQRETLVNRPNFQRVNCWTPCHHRLERWTLALEVSPLRLDVFHSPDFIPPAWGARARVITVHDLHFLRQPEHLTAQSRRYYNGQIHWAIRQADQIIAVSQATCADLVNYTGAQPEKIHVIPEAADPAFRPLPPEEVTSGLARYGLTPGYLLFVGILEPRKNIPGLLRAYHRLIKDHGLDPPLVLAGKPGWLYEDIERVRQELGLTGYPVFTRKPNTDVSYLACAKKLLDAGSEWIYPQFATHNAHTIASVHHFANGRPFEFQRLHGMGADLYAEVIGNEHWNVPCRVYAPVGSHEDLLPYLVRRLLENGANTSFVNR